MHGDDVLRLSDEAGLKHVKKLLKYKHTAKDMGTIGFEDSDANVCFDSVQMTEDNIWTMNLT